MNNNLAIIIEDYQYAREQKYTRFVSEISSISEFIEDVWDCDKLRKSPAQKKGDLRVKFNNIPNIYKNIVKYFAIINFIGGYEVSTISNKLEDIAFLCDFAFEIDVEDITKLSYSFAVGYKKHLDLYINSEKAKNRKWLTANNFCDVFRDNKTVNPFATCPYKNLSYSTIDTKYISDYVFNQTDRIFESEDIHIHIRVVYWLMRLIPSRISEICGIELNCLNMLNGKYVLFIPTWKQNGGYKQPQIRTIYLDYEGKTKYLVDLIKQQQEISTTHQKYLADYKKGLLLTYLKNYDSNTASIKYTISTRNIKTVSRDYVAKQLEKIGIKYDVKDEDGNLFRITSHHFRHKGITDRLEYGFTPEQVRLITEHQNTKMILSSYNHINLNTENILEKGRVVLGEKIMDKAMFRGRILGMDTETEERLLSNVRAHRIHGGICSDITGCNCDMLSCISCEYFVPEIEQLEYFKQQISQWQAKIKKFAAFPIIIQNANMNIYKYETIIDKIYSILGDTQNEKII